MNVTIVIQFAKRAHLIVVAQVVMKDISIIKIIAINAMLIAIQQSMVVNVINALTDIIYTYINAFNVIRIAKHV